MHGWRNVSSVAPLGFIAGFVAGVPVTSGDGADVYADSFVLNIQIVVATIGYRCDTQTSTPLRQTHPHGIHLLSPGPGRIEHAPA